MGKSARVGEPVRVTTGREAIALLAPLLPHSSPNETLIVAFLDEAGGSLGHFRLRGDPASVDLPIRRIIARALRQDARAILLAHNHPSGDPTPSRIDIEVTRQLAEVLKPLGLVLYDHLIRAADEWRSFVAMNLL